MRTKRAGFLGAGALCLCCAACSGANNRSATSAEELTEFRAIAGPRPVPITVIGCATERNGHVVLTELEDAKPYPTTQTFQLSTANAEEMLRKHVGQKVRVYGEAAPPQVVEVREATPSAPVATSGGGNAPKAKVGSEEITKFEVTKIFILSANRTGDPCVTP